jgi:hypothetical protein
MATRPGSGHNEAAGRQLPSRGLFRMSLLDFPAQHWHTCSP